MLFRSVTACTLLSNWQPLMEALEPEDVAAVMEAGLGSLVARKCLEALRRCRNNVAVAASQTSAVRQVRARVGAAVMANSDMEIVKMVARFGSVSGMVQMLQMLQSRMGGMGGMGGMMGMGMGGLLGQGGTMGSMRGAQSPKGPNPAAAGFYEKVTEMVQGMGMPAPDRMRVARLGATLNYNLDGVVGALLDD